MEPSVERGLWIKALAEQVGFKTQAELALALHTTRQTVADWYQGGPIRKHLHRDALCRLLDISLGSLLDGPYYAVNAPGRGLPPLGHLRVFNRRGSGWTQATLIKLLGAMIPAFEETLQRRGEDEVLRLLNLILVEMGPSPRVQKEVDDARRQALFELQRSQQGYRPGGPTPVPVNLDETGPPEPKDWRTGWPSKRQKKWDEEK